MRQFFKYVFASLVAIFLFFFFGFIIIVGIAASTSSKSKKEVKKNSILRLNLDRPIVEKSIDDPFSSLDLPGFSQESTISLIDLKEAIRNAADDERIKGIFIPTGYIRASFTHLDEIRSEIESFKKSGKFVVSYSEVLTEGTYYLTSVSDSIYLYPTGYMELNGLHSETVFITGFLEKIGVKPVVFKVGDFKSAVEPFTRKSMSEENKEQISHVLDGFQNRYLQKVADARGKSVDVVRDIMNEMKIRNAMDAAILGMITRTAYYDEVEETLKNLSGSEDKKKLNFIGYKAYNEATKDKKEKKSSKNRIAVVIAEGEIVDSGDDPNQVSSEVFAEEIRKLRKDDKVKAIVLRVNSPGGSALASDVIWREIVLTKKEKPVIASMSSVAASGGYYISMACDSIVANANTITGSIGVFGLLFNVKELVNDKLGVYSDGVKTGRFSDLANPTREMTEEEKAIVQSEVDEIYRDFTTKAAEGRKMNIDDLLKVSSGRIWSGVDGVENGLVDRIGNLDDAIEMAVGMAQLDDDYSVRYYPAQKNFIERLLEGMNSEAEAKLISKLGEGYVYADLYNKVKSWKGVQARMPFLLEIK